MTSLRVAELPNPQKQALLDSANDLIEHIESGNVISFTVIVDHPDGNYTVLGTSTRSRLQSAGALLDAAITRLKD